MATKTERMLKQGQKAHHFCLWFPAIDTLSSPCAQEYILTDPALVQRIRRILRLESGDTVTLFGHRQSVCVTLRAFSSQQCIVSYERLEPIAPYQPHITLCIPLLEKSALEDAVQRATVLGVTSIQPIITEKTKRQSLASSEAARLERVMISAAEQSKQLCLPHLKQPVLLSKVELIGTVIGFDADTHSLCTAPFLVGSANLTSLTVFIGPEADFTDQEKQWLSAQGCMWYRLTQSILRSEDALMVGIGLLRTCLVVQGG